LLVFWSLPALLICAGVVGYRLIERWSWFDSLYVAVNTLTSLGGAKNAATQTGRVLTLVLALAGVSTIALAATELLGAVLTGELRLFFWSRRMTKRIEALQRHVIVCGYGHVGQHVCAELIADGVPVVVVDREDATLAQAREAGAQTVLGDASDDTTLRRAGIDRARGLVTVAGADPDNVLITMTARLLNPALPIVSRSEHDATVPKLLRAGATRTASPHTIAGERIADVCLHPSSLEAKMRESEVRPGDAFDGKTVGDSGLRARGGPILVAIRHRDGSVEFNPDDDVRVDAGDVLITLNNGPQRDRGNGSARPA
jgi:voltage-gated potassium channel